MRARQRLIVAGFRPFFSSAWQMPQITSPVMSFSVNFPQVGVEIATNLALLLGVAQARLDREVPDNGLLPRALWLDPEKTRSVRFGLQSCYEGFGFFAVLSPRALAYGPAVG